MTRESGESKNSTLKREMNTSSTNQSLETQKRSEDWPSNSLQTVVSSEDNSKVQVQSIAEYDQIFADCIAREDVACLVRHLSLLQNYVSCSFGSSKGHSYVKNAGVVQTDHLLALMRS